ncbi:hypothetical protein [Glacieibacterium frigidum]|uniref:Uncharacterized protein n=1 Tax=Glacieibacterium frigidum TaxID=2593303 RepID=A0A552UHF8_9SPHN|nr:hypothetical protein [Glacieibacterium frigidum]TRW17656.1 hypothetical protein FMM06_05775 [Glacieibacterium frigidum]
MIRPLLLGCVLLTAVPALAQTPAALPEGRFTDYAGRSTELMLGLPGPTLTAGTRSVAELAAEFKRLCVDTALDEAAFDAAVAASSFGWKADPFVYTFGRKGELSLDFGGWKTGDVGVRLIDFGKSFMRGLQCNLTAVITTPADRAAVVGAVAALAGIDAADPANAKQIKRGTFELPTAAGSLLLAGHAFTDGTSRQIIHLGALQRPAKK